MEGRVTSVRMVREELSEEVTTELILGGKNVTIWEKRGVGRRESGGEWCEDSDR